jgi:hypothetical protein
MEFMEKIMAEPATHFELRLGDRCLAFEASSGMGL